MWYLEARRSVEKEWRLVKIFFKITPKNSPETSNRLGRRLILCGPIWKSLSEDFFWTSYGLKSQWVILMQIKYKELGNIVDFPFTGTTKQQTEFQEWNVSIIAIKRILKTHYVQKCHNHLTQYVLTIYGYK